MLPTMSALTHADFQAIARPKRELAGSKSLASMLPMLLTTGLITLIISAVTRLLWLGFSNDFFSAWMEAWLITWPIAFPLAYIGMPLVKGLTNFLAARASMNRNSTKISGLAISQIEKVSSNATSKNRLQVVRTTYFQPYH
jgi:hypothetical protein